MAHYQVKKIIGPIVDFFLFPSVCGYIVVGGFTSGGNQSQICIPKFQRRSSHTMAIPLAKLLISAVAVFMLVSASFATSEMPFMVVHKKATLNRLKSGAERVLVSFDIYNQGSASVLSLSIHLI